MLFARPNGFARKTSSDSLHTLGRSVYASSQPFAAFELRLQLLQSQFARAIMRHGNLQCSTAHRCCICLVTSGPLLFAAIRSEAHSGSEQPGP